MREIRSWNARTKEVEYEKESRTRLWLLRFAVTFSYVVHCILRTKVQTTSTCGGSRVFLARPRLCGAPPVVYPDSNLRLKGNLTTLLGGLKNADAKADY
ncbi:hypothetical protein ALC57_03698 [Trachymyrmex cornetzi]|uniref:Uncharacterized protein n=1 Tax=Trachymyrmex cornetzi TaxID=471704 RepID=A0A151JLY3_9HYME|nr:hypothetical protein ALC57_03698 [Trachymyrmex cornetzi]